MNAGFDVRYVGVFSTLNYSEYSPSDLPVGVDANELIARSLLDTLTSDIICGNAISDDPQVKREMCHLISDFRPDIIELEQDYSYLGLRRVLEELGIQPKIVMSSHNIESTLKHDVLMSYGISVIDANRVKKELLEIERSLVQSADLVVACNRRDAIHLQRCGGKDIVIAPNGVCQWAHDEERSKQWSEKFAALGVDRFGTFVGSAHAPNVDGFLAMVGAGVGFLRPDMRLVVAGGVGGLLEEKVDVRKSETLQNATFWMRVVSAGRISDEDLHGLIDASDALLLPITYGGGSNLKTAEALISGKRIVSTSVAFRSFEWARSLPGVVVEDDPKRFREEIGKALSSGDFAGRSLANFPELSRVLWEDCLKDLIARIARL